MPLVLCAVNFKLATTKNEIESRRQLLECLNGLISASRNLYDVADFMSTQTDDILYLAYRTCEQVFLQTPGTALSMTETPNKTPKRVSFGTGMDFAAGHITNWHDAFLRHPRTYLLISMTVDYFLSIGQLPQRNTLPNMVCIVPSLGEIRLPWTSRQCHPPVSKISEENSGIAGSNIRQLQSPRNKLPNIDEIKSTCFLPPSSNLGTYREPTKGLHEEIGRKDNGVGFCQNNQVNLDYFSLGPQLDKPPPVPPSDQSSHFGASPLSQSELWQLLNSYML